MAQDDPEKVGTPAFPILPHDESSLTKINLSFGPRICLHPPKRQGILLSELSDKALNVLIASLKAFFCHEVLMDPFGGRPPLRACPESWLDALHIHFEPGKTRWSLWLVLA